MNKLLFILIITVLVLTSVTYGDYQIDWYTINGGGGQSSSSQYIITGTIGQHDAAYSASANYELLGGFWQPQPLCFVDFPDYSVFADYWLELGTAMPADLYEDGTINVLDLEKFAQAWLCWCPYYWPLR